MSENPKETVFFVCRDCGKEYAADDVMIPDAEPISRKKLPIADNQCPQCGGIIDLKFPSSD